MPGSWLLKASLFGAFFVSALAASASIPPCSSPRMDDYAHVDYVYDGDTLRLKDGRIIRLIAINTPEIARKKRPGEPLGKTAQRFLREQLKPGSRVGLRWGQEKRDHYDRLLAHVFTAEGDNLQAMLLEKGLAFTIARPPNLWANRCYRQIEKHARQHGKGVWGHAHYQPIPASQINAKTRGFHLVKGKITQTHESQHVLWLKMGKQFAIKIPKEQLKFFAASPYSLREKQVTVRGWISRKQRQSYMTLHHPLDLDISS